MAARALPPHAACRFLPRPDAAGRLAKGPLMLQVLGRRGPVQCDGASRRDFLKVGTLGASGLALADLLKARAGDTAAGRATKNTSVVWLWLGGGPTHVETFDPKMS